MSCGPSGTGWGAGGLCSNGLNSEVEELVGAQGSFLARLSFCYHENPKFGKNQRLAQGYPAGYRASSWASVGVSTSDFLLTLEGEKSNE